MSHEDNRSNRGRRSSKEHTRPQKPSRRGINTTEIIDFLSTIDTHVTPTLHVNGPHHPTAVMSVDFGAPLQPVRLTSEVVQELQTLMRGLTRELYAGDVNVRFSADNSNGVFWTSVA